MLVSGLGAQDDLLSSAEEIIACVEDIHGAIGAKHGGASPCSVRIGRGTVGAGSDAWLWVAGPIDKVFRPKSPPA